MVKIQDVDVKSVHTKSNLPVSDYSVNLYVAVPMRVSIAMPHL